MKLRGRAIVLIVLLVFVPLTAVLTASPAHAGGPYPDACYTSLPPYGHMCIVLGQPDFTTVTAGQPPSPTTIGNPTAVAFDSKGDVWVVDSSNNRVLEYEPPFTTGEAASLVIGQTSLTGSGDSSPAGSLFGPTGIAFDPSGNLWVVDSGNNRVLEFKTPFSNGESASLVIGQPTFGGYIGQTTQGGLNAPSYIAFDPSGNLWVTDQGNNRVLEFYAPFSTGEDASRVVGQEDFTSYAPSSTTTATSLFEPVGITFDSKGDLWVVDSGDHRVLEYTPLDFAPPRPINYASASVVIGQSSLTGTSTALNAYAIAFDSGGNLWVSDGINGVREYEGPVSTGEAGIQEVGPAVNGTGTSPGDKLRDPQGIALDANDNLWVADYDHGRVVVYGSAVIRTTSSSSSTSTTTSAGGGVPEFPYQFAAAVAFTVLIAASYLLVRRRVKPWTDASQAKPAPS